MKRLLLLRHAKSSWGDPLLADRDRPLNQRGDRDATLIGEEMARRGLLADRILCSPARRTRDTLAALLPSYKTEPDIIIAEALYEPASRDYRSVIGADGGRAPTLLVIGHNPTIHATALALIHTKRTGPEAELAPKFPTAALAAIDLDIRDWSAIGRKAGRLALFLRPRDLRGGGEESDD